MFWSRAGRFGRKGGCLQPKCVSWHHWKMYFRQMMSPKKEIISQECSGNLSESGCWLWSVEDPLSSCGCCGMRGLWLCQPFAPVLGWEAPSRQGPTLPKDMGTLSGAGTKLTPGRQEKKGSRKIDLKRKKSGKKRWEQIKNTVHTKHRKEYMTPCYMVLCRTGCITGRKVCISVSYG